MKKIFFVSLFLLTYQGFTQVKDSLLKVSDNVYMITGLGANVSFLVSENCVIVVDAGMYLQAGNIIKARVKSVTDKPIKYLVYTHHHFDHILGAHAFKPEAIVIAHENVVKNLFSYDSIWLDRYRKRIETQSDQSKYLLDSLKKVSSSGYLNHEHDYLFTQKELQMFDSIEIVYPDLTFNDKMSLFIGADTVNMYYPGHSHTNCSILVEYKRQNVLVAGDFLFVKSMPYIPKGCNTSNLIDQFNYFGKKNYSFIIPGHGNQVNGNEMLDQANYLTQLRSEVQKHMDDNKTLEQIQALVTMPDYSHFGLKHLLKGEIEVIYKELLNLEN